MAHKKGHVEGNEMIANLKNAVSALSTQNHSSFVIEPNTRSSIKGLLYNALWEALKGTIALDTCLAGLYDIVELHPDVPSLFADVFSILDVETLCSDNKEHRDRFLSFVHSSLALVSDGLLKERLDQDTLEALGYMQSKQSFQTKYVKTKTRLFYKQQKFNLYREESEGYSKLITELSQPLTSAVTPHHMLEVIKALIGCFNLDPNRVLDVIVESFECRPEEHVFFVGLLTLYNTDKAALCHLVGFKYQYYQVQSVDTPYSLHELAALLLRADLIDLQLLYSYLGPTDSELVDKHNKDMTDAREYARRQNVVSLGEKVEAKEAADRARDREQRDRDRADRDHRDSRADRFNNDKEDKEPTGLTTLDHQLQPQQAAVGSNQKVCLVEALISNGAWPQAKRLIDRYPPFSITGYLNVTRAFTRLLHHTIEPLYSQCLGALAPVVRWRRPVKEARLAQVRQVHTLADLATVLYPLIAYVGPYLSSDTVLIVKLLRIGRFILERRSQCQAGDKAMPATVMTAFCGFLTVMEDAVLPAVSLLPANCCVAEEVWNYLKMLDYTYRYRLYAGWKSESQIVAPRSICARADVLKKAKYIMKRLTKENVKQFGRLIGKLSHSCPGVLFDYVLTHIQKYDNLIGPVVDSLKYLTNLSYDVLSYSIIEALANPARQKMKDDDTNTMLWLQSLANLSGAIFKKYSVECAGLLQYVANQLKAGKSYDLLVMREVIQKMSGIEVSEEATADQLDALNGGELLKQECGYFAQIRNTKRSSGRLREMLLEHNLAIPLCVLIAQQRHAIVYGQTQGDANDKRPIKLTGKLYDQAQDTLVQFVTFLSTQLSLDEFQQHLPTMDVLLNTCHIGTEAAFALWRPVYMHAITVKFDELRRAERKDKSVVQNPNSKQIKFIEAAEQVLAPVMDQVQTAFSSRSWDDYKLLFYVLFWTLAMSDLQVPSGMYEKQVQQLTAQLAAIDNNKDLSQSKKRKERERCQAVIDKLHDEEKKQLEHVRMVMALLKERKDTWFGSRSLKQTVVTSLLQYCIFPRLCFTASDAVYCAKIISLLHSIKTANFASLICYDRILCDITLPMCSFTENEAHRYGRFLNSIFEDIMRWHSDKGIFEKECGSHPGFHTSYRKAGDGPSSSDRLDYENYRHLVHKWHLNISKVMIKCLDSGDFVHIRNALIVLIQVSTYYPRVSKFGAAVEKKVEKVCQEQKEKRPDLYALAFSYFGQLKIKKKTWVQEQAFHKMDKPAGPEGAASAKSSGGSTPVHAKQEPMETADCDGQSAAAPAENGSTAANSTSAGEKSSSSSASASKKSKDKSSSSSRTAENGDSGSQRSSKDKEAKVKEEKVKGSVKEDKHEGDNAKVKAEPGTTSRQSSVDRATSSSSKADKSKSPKDKDGAKGKSKEAKVKDKDKDVRRSSKKAAAAKVEVVPEPVAGEAEEDGEEQYEVKEEVVSDSEVNDQPQDDAGSLSRRLAGDGRGDGDDRRHRREPTSRTPVEDRGGDVKRRKLETSHSAKDLTSLDTSDRDRRYRTDNGASDDLKRDRKRGTERSPSQESKRQRGEYKSRPDTWKPQEAPRPLMDFRGDSDSRMIDWQDGEASARPGSDKYSSTRKGKHR